MSYSNSGQLWKHYLGIYLMASVKWSIQHIPYPPVLSFALGAQLADLNRF
nr:hypothetical protein [Acinetobacter sp. YH12126]